MKVTMDRYQADWPMVELGWKTHVKGEGRQFASAMEAVETYRKENDGIIDQDLPAFVIAEATVLSNFQWHSTMTTSLHLTEAQSPTYASQVCCSMTAT